MCAFAWAYIPMDGFRDLCTGGSPCSKAEKKAIERAGEKGTAVIKSALFYTIPAACYCFPAFEDETYSFSFQNGWL